MGNICVIIPTHNRANYILSALDSIDRQTYPVTEIVIVNDGSTDNTLEVLAGSKYKDRLSVHTQQNAGKAAAMNLGLSKATAEYVIFFDDDDILADDGLAPLAQALDEDPTLDFVYGIHQKFADNAVDQRRMPEFWGMPVTDRTLLNVIGNLYPFQGATLVRRRLYEKIGNFNASFQRCQDVEMMIRMALYGHARYVPHIVFYQRGHSGARYVPGGTQITAEEALTRAVIHDQRALLMHQDELTLDRVTPLHAETLPDDLRKRSALLHRASMYARRAMWPQALDDLDKALLVSDKPAVPQDIARLSFCVVKPQMCDLLWHDTASLKRLRAMYTSSPMGKLYVTSLLRPIPWHVKTGFLYTAFSAGCRRAALAVRVLGLLGTVALVIDKKVS